MVRSRSIDVYPISLRDLEVVSVEDVTPNLRRIGFSGEQLQAFSAFGVDSPALVSTGFDDDIRIIFPHPVTGARPFPPPLGNGSLQWTEEVKDLFRTYTVRSYDAARGVLVIDFARHGDGLAERFCASAQPGDRVFIAGPKLCRALPANVDWLALCGDHTALPAIARCLEQLPRGQKAIAIIEVPSAADRLTLATLGDVDIHWVCADEGGNFADTAMKALATAPAGQGFLWAAGEATKLKTIRALAKQLGLPREHVDITGYWRAHEQAVSEDGVPVNARVRAVEKLHDVLDILPAVALDAALQLGVLEVLYNANVPMDASRIAAQLPETAADTAAVPTAVMAQRITRLLRYLATTGLVVAHDAEQFSLHSDYPQLFEFAQLKSMITSHMRPEIFNLAQALRATPSSPNTQTQAAEKPQTNAAAKPQTNAAELGMRSARWTAPAVAVQLDPATIGECAPLLVHGPGAAVYAEEWSQRHGQVAVTENADAPDAEEFPDTASLLLVDPFAHNSQAGVCALLAQAAQQRCWIVSALVDPAANDAELCEQDLVRFCDTGGSIPTAQEVARAAAEAGWVVESSAPVGWGNYLIALVR